MRSVTAKRMPGTPSTNAKSWSIPVLEMCSDSHGARRAASGRDVDRRTGGALAARGAGTDSSRAVWRAALRASSLRARSNRYGPDGTLRPQRKNSRSPAKPDLRCTMSSALPGGWLTTISAAMIDPRTRFPTDLSLAAVATRAHDPTAIGCCWVGSRKTTGSRQRLPQIPRRRVLSSGFRLGALLTWRRCPWG